MASEMQCPDKGANSFPHSTHQSETRTTANLGPLALEHNLLSSGKIPTSPWHHMEEAMSVPSCPSVRGTNEFRCIQGKARASQDQFPDQCL